MAACLPCFFLFVVRSSIHCCLHGAAPRFRCPRACMHPQGTLGVPPQKKGKICKTKMLPRTAIAPPRSGQMYARLLPDILMDRVPTTTDGTPLPVAVRARPAQRCLLLWCLARGAASAACCLLLAALRGARCCCKEGRSAALLCSMHQKKSKKKGVLIIFERNPTSFLPAGRGRAGRRVPPPRGSRSAASCLRHQRRCNAWSGLARQF